MTSSTFDSNAASEETIGLIPDFDRVWNSIDFDEHNLAAGTIVTDQFYGVEFSSSSEFDLMLFDTNNITGEDFDLESTNLKNVLIISEVGDRGGDIIRGGAGDDILAANRVDHFLMQSLMGQRTCPHVTPKTRRVFCKSILSKKPTCAASLR